MEEFFERAIGLLLNKWFLLAHILIDLVLVVILLQISIQPNLIVGIVLIPWSIFTLVLILLIDYFY
jgi:succinate-acetate transporter protein